MKASDRWDAQCVADYLKRQGFAATTVEMSPPLSSPMHSKSTTYAVTKRVEETWESVTLTLPYPPSVDALYATVNKRRVLTSTGRQYNTWAIRDVEQQWPEGVNQPLHGRLEVTLRLYPAHTKASDIDNRAKAILDALEKARVYVNDNQIDALHIYRERMTTGGKVEVELRPY